MHTVLQGALRVRLLRSAFRQYRDVLALSDQHCNKTHLHFASFVLGFLCVHGFIRASKSTAVCAFLYKSVPDTE